MLHASRIKHQRRIAILRTFSASAAGVSVLNAMLFLPEFSSQLCRSILEAPDQTADKRGRKPVRILPARLRTEIRPVE